MSVGLLLITQGRFGEDLLQIVASVMGACPLASEHLAISQDGELDALVAEAHTRCDRLDGGDGVLVLVDMYGSTPGNIALQLLKRRGVRVVAGLNLPMLVRVLNYPELDLDDTAAKALSGGRDGIILCERE